MLKITDLRLLENMDNEFAFIITDTHSNDKDISPFFNYAKEGNNPPSTVGQCKMHRVGLPGTWPLVALQQAG